MKKIIILPLGFILVHILYLGCCKCVEGNYFRELSSTRALQYSHLNNTSLDTVYIKDTLFTTIQFNFNYISKTVVNPFAGMVNAAWATSCHCSVGDKGYKYKIDSVVITSNKNFNSIPAGSNIAGFFNGLCITCSNSSPSYIPLTRLADSLGVNNRYDGLSLIITQHPGAEKIHSFKYAVFSNGKKYEAVARAMAVWQ